MWTKSNRIQTGSAPNWNVGPRSGSARRIARSATLVLPYCLYLPCSWRTCLFSDGDACTACCPRKKDFKISMAGTEGLVPSASTTYLESYKEIGKDALVETGPGTGHPRDRFTKRKRLVRQTSCIDSWPTSPGRVGWVWAKRGTDCRLVGSQPPTTPASWPPRVASWLAGYGMYFITTVHPPPYQFRWHTTGVRPLYLAQTVSPKYKICSVQKTKEGQVL